MIYFGSQHLQEIFPEIASWPLEERAAYADSVTIANCNNIEWLRNQFSNLPEYDFQWRAQFSFFNATSIGNLSYIIVNCRYSYYVNQCRYILQIFNDTIGKS